MNALLLAAMLAAGPSPAATTPDESDLRCYRVMAELARAENPAARGVGLAAAHYFLGRIDAAAPGYDTSSAPAVSPAERPALIRRCGEALNANGFDLRALGASRDRPEPDA
jgi:hypothetical protein